MDEVMKALTVSDDTDAAPGDNAAGAQNGTTHHDTSPLLSRRHHHHQQRLDDASDGTQSFDNIAMTRCDSTASTNGADVSGGTVTHATLRQEGGGSSQDNTGGSAASSLELTSAAAPVASDTLKKKRRSKLRIVSVTAAAAATVTNSCTKMPAIPFLKRTGNEARPVRAFG